MQESQISEKYILTCKFFSYLLLSWKMHWKASLTWKSHLLLTLINLVSGQLFQGKEAFVVTVRSLWKPLWLVSEVGKSESRCHCLRAVCKPKTNTVRNGYIHIDVHLNICSPVGFSSSTNKTFSPHNFCIQYPNIAFFDASKSSLIC